MESISYPPVYSFVRAIEQLVNSLVLAGWETLWLRGKSAQMLFSPFRGGVGGWWGGGQVHG